MTPSTRAWSITVTVVIPSCMTGPLPPIMERLRFEPIQSSSVLSVFSLSLFAAIHWSMSMMHCCSRIMADGASSWRQCTYHCVSSANAWCLTPWSSALSASSAAYSTNICGPRTEPCGTEQTTSWWSLSIDAWTLGTSLFTVSHCPAREISVLLSKIYCTYHVTDSTRTATWLCHCRSVRLEQSSRPCLQSELHWSCFQTPAKDIFVRTVLAHPAH